MKANFIKTSIIIAVSTIFFACTVQKRIYNQGYYIHSKKQNNISKTPKQSEFEKHEKKSQDISENLIAAADNNDKSLKEFVKPQPPKTNLKSLEDTDIQDEKQIKILKKKDTTVNLNKPLLLKKPDSKHYKEFIDKYILALAILSLLYSLLIITAPLGLLLGWVALDNMNKTQNYKLKVLQLQL